MTKPILAATLAVLLAAAPAVAESPTTSQPVLTSLVRAQIALEDGDLAAVQAAVGDAYLAARVAAVKGAKAQPLDAVGKARTAATYALDLLTSAIGPNGACRVRKGFDGNDCTAKANNALNRIGAANSGSVWITSLDNQDKVTETLIRAFGASIEPHLNDAIAAAKEEGS